jgi:site-specific recombinase XerC
LKPQQKSPRTVRSYLDSARALHAFLVRQGLPSDLEGVDAEHIRAFLLAEEQRTSGRVGRCALP